MWNRVITHISFLRKLIYIQVSIEKHALCRHFRLKKIHAKKSQTKNVVSDEAGGAVEVSK